MVAYVAQLREFAQYCEFGDSLGEMLRDCLVCGIADISMQWVLLAEPELGKAKDYMAIPYKLTQK